MKMKTLKEGIVTHADGLGKLFKFSAEHTCRSMLHSLEGFTNMELVTFRELTAGFFLGFSPITYSGAYPFTFRQLIRV